MLDSFDLWGPETDVDVMEFESPLLPIVAADTNGDGFLQFNVEEYEWKALDSPFRISEYCAEYLEEIDIKFDPAFSVVVGHQEDPIPNYTPSFDDDKVPSSKKMKGENKPTPVMIKPPKKEKKRMYQLTLEECPDRSTWTKVKRAINTKRFHERRKSKDAAAEKLLERLLAGKPLGQKRIGLLQQHFPTLYKKYVMESLPQ